MRRGRVTRYGTGISGRRAGRKVLDLRGRDGRRGKARHCCQGRISRSPALRRQYQPSKSAWRMLSNIPVPRANRRERRAWSPWGSQQVGGGRRPTHLRTASRARLRAAHGTGGRWNWGRVGVSVCRLLSAAHGLGCLQCDRRPGPPSQSPRRSSSISRPRRRELEGVLARRPWRPRGHRPRGVDSNSSGV